MKLTERQIKIRSIFRNCIIDNWISNKIFMFNTITAVSNELSIGQIQANEEMCAIPSIGWVPGTMPINVWTAKYYKQIADALWSGKSKEQVLTLWAKTKKTTDTTPKLNATERKEHSTINKNHKKLAAIAELRKSSPDRWGKTAWGKCK